MKLTPDELTAVLALITPKDGVERQASRICRLLATGAFRTGAVASKCSVGNISDVVTTVINPKINKLGLFIGCVKPPRTLHNKFNQKCGDWLYSFYTADIASNDNDYGDADADGASAKDWEKELEVVFDDWEKDLTVVFDGEPDLLDRVLNLVEGASAKDWEKELEVVFDDEPESGLENLELNLSSLDKPLNVGVK